MYSQVYLLFFILQCHLIINVLGECCPAYQIMLCKPDGTDSKYTAPYCLDCSEPDLFCAHGNCNVFGCNCDGGCRVGKCSQACTPCRDPAQNITNKAAKEVYNVPLFTIETIMQRADLDRDGLLSMVEASNWLSVVYDIPKDKLTKKIKVLDANKDGFISSQEIDGKGDEKVRKNSFASFM